MKKLKFRVYNLIRDDDENDLASSIFDSVIIILIIINVALVILDTFDLPDFLIKISYYIEIVSVIIFTIEYFLRLWTSDLKDTTTTPIKARIKYVFSFMALIDLFAILPFYIPFLLPIDLRVLRTLRIVRLMRLFKFNRYTSALSTVGNVMKRKSSQLISSMIVVGILMTISSILMYSVENVVQPDVFKNAFSGLWWSVATFTTVGYGDIYPITTIGKILSGVISILGIGLVAVPTGIVSAGFVESDETEKIANVKNKCFCPYCGENIDDKNG